MHSKKAISICIIILCSACLYGLYLFSYNADHLETIPSDVQSIKVIENSKNFSFNPEILTYDGQGKLNYLYGVKYKNHETSDDLSYTIEPTDSIDSKLIVYKMQDDNYIEKSSRPLQLINYHFPSIKIPEPASSVEKDEIDNLYSIINYDDVFVDNGFGNNEKNKLTFEYEPDSKDSAQINYSLYYTNMCGDSVSSTFSTEIKDYTYRIVLKQDVLNIKKYESFNPLDYIESCTDKNHQNAINRLSVYDDVNKAEKGVYSVFYTLGDTHMKLTVIVS